MPIRKRRYVAISCDLADVEKKLEYYCGEGYGLMDTSAYQVGIGYGSKVNVLVTFELKPELKKAT